MDKKTKFEKTLEQFEEIIFKSGLDHNGRNGQFSSRAAPRLFCAVDSDVIKYLGNMGVKKIKELCPSFKGFYKLAYENKDDCLLYPYKKYYIIEFSFDKYGRVPTDFEKDLFLNPKNEYCILKDILPFCKIDHSALKILIIFLDLSKYIAQGQIIIALSIIYKSGVLYFGEYLLIKKLQVATNHL